MAQWIKNISTGRTSTLEDEGYKSLQDASNAGYSPITADSLKTETPFNLPTMQPEPNYQATMSSITVPTAESILNTAPTKTETAQEDMTSKYLKALEEYGGKQAAQIKAEETAGLPTYTKELTDVNAQIQALQKEALAIPLQMQEEAKGRGITAAGLSPLQSDRTRQNTIKALGLSSIAQTLQGNVALAQSQANKAVELEFAPLQAKIDYLKEALRLNEGKLTKEEAKQAKLQEIKLNERQALLDQQKEDKNTILSTAQEAAQNGADALTIQNIQNAKDSVSALSIYSTFAEEKELIDNGYVKLKPSQLSKYTEEQIYRADNGDIYLKPIDNTLLSIAEAKSLGVPYGTTKSEALTKNIVPGSKISSSVGGASIVDTNTGVEVPADSASQSILAQTGLSIPAFAFLTQGTTALTRMSADQRLQYMNEAENYLNKTGTDIATFKSQYNALGKTVEANSLRNNQASVAEAELDATINNLKTAADESSFSKIRWANVAKLFAGKEVNDPNVLKYAFHLQQLREEFAMYNAAIAGQIDANGNIKEITDADYQRAENIIKDGIAQGGLDGFENALKASRSKMQIVLQNSIDAQNKQVWKLFGVEDKFKNKVIEQIPVAETQPKTEQSFWSKAKNWLFGD